MKFPSTKKRKGPPPAELPVKGVVSIDRMVGEDAEETTLFKLASRAAEKYLQAFPWCRQIVESYFGDGIGGVVEVFLFRIVPGRPEIDEWLWVVVGDVPPAYLVIDNCKAPSEALSVYIQQVSKWVELAKQHHSSVDVIPVSAPPTPEEAAILEKRLEFLREFVVPRFRDAETERS